MFQNFEEVAVAAKNSGRRVACIAVADDEDLLRSVRLAEDEGLITPLLVGDAKKITPLLEQIGSNDTWEIVDEKDPQSAALKAVELVSSGRAQLLMKGAINTSDMMRAVLDKQVGLRTGRVLSHLAAFQIPGWQRLLFVTDGGINIAPDLAGKKDILTNALLALASVGYSKPNVALLTANEQVNPKAIATVDAAALVDAWRGGAFSVPCTLEGPIALDVALSQESARHKQLDSAISGVVDLFLASSIEVGNVLGKSLVYFAGARIAGLVLGASAPIVLTSRSESVESKLCSIALASLAASR